MSIVAFAVGASGGLAVGLTIGAIVYVPRVGPWRGGRPAEPQPVIVVQEQDLRAVPAGRAPQLFPTSTAGELPAGLADVLSVRSGTDHEELRALLEAGHVWRTRGLDACTVEQKILLLRASDLLELRAGGESR